MKATHVVNFRHSDAQREALPERVLLLGVLLNRPGLGALKNLNTSRDPSEMKG